jgi:hypothetical protein
MVEFLKIKIKWCKVLWSVVYNGAYKCSALCYTHKCDKNIVKLWKYMRPELSVEFNEKNVNKYMKANEVSWLADNHCDNDCERCCQAKIVRYEKIIYKKIDKQS